MSSSVKPQTQAMTVDQGAPFGRFRKRTKLEGFVDAAEMIVPWSALCALIEPHYPELGNRRRPADLEHAAHSPAATLVRPDRQRRGEEVV
jgi:hypothetical protein